MTGKSEIKKSLNHAVDQLPQPSFKIISETPVEKMKEMDSYTYQEPVHRKFNLSSFSRSFSGHPAYRFAVACICLVLCLSGGWYTRQNLLTDSVIDVDVNPSFELAINRRERILSLTALNGDAAQILEKRNYKGWELEAAIESLCTVMEENGYLDSGRRTILVSVENKDQERSNQLKEQLNVYIKGSLKEKSVQPRIVTQNRKSEKTTVNAAKNYNISPGKLQFIRSMVERYPDLEEDELVKLSMEDLYAIIRHREEKAPDWFEIEEEDWDDDGDDRDEGEEENDLGDTPDSQSGDDNGDDGDDEDGDDDDDDRSGNGGSDDEAGRGGDDDDKDEDDKDDEDDEAGKDGDGDDVADKDRNDDGDDEAGRDGDDDDDEAGRGGNDDDDEAGRGGNDDDNNAGRDDDDDDERDDVSGEASAPVKTGNRAGGDDDDHDDRDDQGPESRDFDDSDDREDEEDTGNHDSDDDEDDGEEAENDDGDDD